MALDTISATGQCKAWLQVHRSHSAYAVANREEGAGVGDTLALGLAMMLQGAALALLAASYPMICAR